MINRTCKDTNIRVQLNEDHAGHIVHGLHIFQACTRESTLVPDACECEVGKGAANFVPQPFEIWWGLE